MLRVRGFEILDDAGVFSPSADEKQFYLRSFQICSNLSIKSVYTSDISYNVQSFPKEVALKAPRGQDWFSEFSWISVPDEHVPEKPEDAVPKKVKFEEGKKKARRSEKENTRANKQTLTGWRHARKAKKEEERKGEVTQEAEEDEDEPEEETKVPEPISEELMAVMEARERSDMENVTRTLKEIEELKELTGMQPVKTKQVVEEFSITQEGTLAQVF